MNRRGDRRWLGEATRNQQPAAAVAAAWLLGAAAITPAAVLAQAPASPPSPAPEATAFVHVAVIPMDRERVLHDQTVVVQGNQIIALGPAKRVRVPAGATEIDGRGKFLIPGLADCHTHNSNLEPPNSGRLFRYLAYGVTTIRDMHGGGADSMAQGLQAKRAVARGAVLGPRIYTAGDPEFQERVTRSSFAPDTSDIRMAGPATAALKAAGHDFVKLNGFLRPIYDSIIATAALVGLGVVGHVPFDVSLEQVLRDRWASIEHLTGYLGAATGVIAIENGHLNPRLAAMDTAPAPWWNRQPWRQGQQSYRWPAATLRRLAEATRRAGVWNCATLSIYVPDPDPKNVTLRAGLQRVIDPATSPLPSDERLLMHWWYNVSGYDGFAFQMVRALQTAGAGLLLGSDQGPEGQATHRELQLLVEAGLTPYQALVTGTRNMAQFLGTLDRAGTVAVGKWADLVLLDADPLANIANTTQIRAVVANGRYYDRAALEQILAEVRARAKAEVELEPPPEP